MPAASVSFSTTTCRPSAAWNSSSAFVPIHSGKMLPAVRAMPSSTVKGNAIPSRPRHSHGATICATAVGDRIRCRGIGVGWYPPDVAHRTEVDDGALDAGASDVDADAPAPHCETQ
jgi:hypothetical protein